MQHDFVKITGALYRILDFLPDHDPLKNKAKEKAITILEGLTLMFEHNGFVVSNWEKVTLELLAHLAVLENCLKLARSQEWVDSMNFFIISREYAAIKEQVLRQKPLPLQTVQKEVVVQNSGPAVKVKKPILDAPKLPGRQEKILKILGKKQKAQVADILKEIPSVTKRTLRRDLDALLKTKHIVREGEFNQVLYRKVDRT